MVLDEHISNPIGTKDVNPSMASLTNGSFVVTWKSLYFSGNYGVDGQLYDPSGVSKEMELGGSASYVSRLQQYPSVTALKDGGFVVIWPSEGGIGSDIYGRRYDADGAPLGTEFHINAYYDYSSLDIQYQKATIKDRKK